jgi:hypothetical protein
MRLGLWGGRLGVAAALMIALALGFALLSGPASAETVSHSGHAEHRHMAGAPAAGETVMIRVWTGDTDRAPCHPASTPSIPPCCAGASCLSMHVGLAVVSLFAVAAEASTPDRPATAPLFAGVAAPPDLPPPRRG